MAERALENGREAVVPDLSAALAPDGPHWERQAALAIEAVETGDDAPAVRLVAHSASGPLLPVIADRLTERGVTVEGSVFVDATLPHPGRSRLGVLPQRLAQQIESMAVDGRIPPWPSWWSHWVIERLLPDAALRERFIASCPELPVDLFTEEMPESEEKALGTCRYVRLSETYDDEAAEAVRAGWEVRRHNGNHLSILTEPSLVLDLMGANAES